MDRYSTLGADLLISEGPHQPLSHVLAFAW